MIRRNPIFIILFIVFACKTQRIIPDTYVSTNKDTLDVLTQDSIYLITQLGDTLSSLDEEVEVYMERFLCGL